jgi:hypothetical protein
LTRDVFKRPFNLSGVMPVGVEQEYAAHSTHPSELQVRIHRRAVGNGR